MSEGGTGRNSFTLLLRKIKMVPGETLDKLPCHNTHKAV
ncbi:hypothetical protein predicted by Glimmer/Critica [Acetobacter senegalensis]|uniref:Uncharacterized protein n=1 Tax=Acetobacter senegalensis TaxID=446692 RepID=A0A0U5FK86_9PROT|nr:hypothetical protein predicted by Glimmer/Critica [Acetobacter senegalensis]